MTNTFLYKDLVKRIKDSGVATTKGKEGTLRVSRAKVQDYNQRMQFTYNDQLEHIEKTKSLKEIKKEIKIDIKTGFQTRYTYDEQGNKVKKDWNTLIKEHTTLETKMKDYADMIYNDNTKSGQYLYSAYKQGMKNYTYEDIMLLITDYEKSRRKVIAKGQPIQSPFDNTGTSRNVERVYKKKTLEKKLKQLRKR